MRFLSLLLLLLPVAALAHDTVRITNGWSPPSLSQSNGVGFLTLNAPTADALVAASSSCCQAVELHTHVTDGDIVRMRRVSRIELPSHKNVTLRPGGYHLMLIGLKQPLVDGDRIKVRFEFVASLPREATLVVDRQQLLKRLKKNPASAHPH